MSTTRMRTLLIEEAKGYVTKDRNTSYGEPEDNFQNIADIWNAQGVSIDGRPVNATDVSLMMLGMKLARLRFNPGHRDSWVDSIGYAACGGGIAVSEEIRSVFPKVTDEDVAEIRADAAQKLRDFQEGDRANVDELAQRREQAELKGWVNPMNMCGDRINPSQYDRFGARNHPAHSFNDKASWCDGYVSPDLRQESDLDVIKRVDAKLGKMQGRPIKDAPQA